MTFDEALATLRSNAEQSVDAMVRQYAAESGVSVEQWLVKCTVDVSYRLLKTIDGEELVMTCKARKR